MSSNNPREPIYTVLRLPRSPPFTAKYRETKLLAIEKTPAEYLYPHAAEAKHPLSIWEARLAYPTNVLVCVATTHPTLSTEETLLQGEWVGFAAIRGPLAFDMYYASPDMQQAIPEDWEAETRWHIYDLYVFPAHRGRGLARKLVATCIATVGELGNTNEEEQQRRARIRLFTNPKVEGLVDTYVRWGFQESGKVCLREGLEANAMAESVPENTASSEELSKMWEYRFGVAMEKVVDYW